MPSHNVPSVKRRKAQHPMQPLVWDKNVIRFKRNKIIDYLWESGKIDLNALAALPFPAEDRMQLAQLIGYSVSGFGELSYASRKAVAEADALAEKMSTQRRRKK